MTLVEVKDKKTKEAFRKVPFLIYKSDPHFIAHIRQDIEKIFDQGSNKLLRSGKAIRWVVLNDLNEPVGRVAAFIHPTMNDSSPYPVGGMGFFESIDDKNVAFRLFDACRDWLADQGFQAMDGPINLGERDKYWGLITENFDLRPHYGQNYNPAYYVKFFEDYGFQVRFDQFIYYRKVDQPLENTFRLRAERLEKDASYSCHHIQLSNIEVHTEEFRTVYNRAWAIHKGFKKMSGMQARAIIGQLKPVIDERLIWFAYYDNKPIGFYMGLPELNEVFAKVGDNLNLWGKLKFMIAKKFHSFHSSFGVVFGVDPDFQGKGVEGYIFQHMANEIQKKKLYKGITITWIGDFNAKMIRIVESLGSEKVRTLTTYRKPFDEKVRVERVKELA